MTEIKKKKRIAQLKAMHNAMIYSNDENIYISWVTCGVPDCPSEDDYEFIAGDDESYNEACDLFTTLIKKKGYRW